MSKKRILILLLIVLLGASLRFYQLGRIQPGFYKDEAALGFNTWSILKTGADEYGQKWPLFIRSFEVFFLPVYSYLSIPFFWLLGATETATRVLSAISGTILILVVFLISKELFKSEKIGLLTALIVSLTPWSVFYSRGAFEGNLSLFFFSLGFYFWIKFENQQKNQWFFTSLLFFVLSMYSYQSPRLVAPFFLLLSVLSTKKWIKNLKLWFWGIGFALLLYFPILVKSFSPASYFRAARVSLFRRETPLPGYSSKLGNWQYLYLVPREFLSLYLHYFSPNNLFSQADYNPQRKVPNFSVFNFWQLPLFLIGLWQVYKKDKKDFPNKKAFWLWLLLSPLPASLTGDPFHTYRAILLFLPISIIIGLGFEKVLQGIKKYQPFAGFLIFILIAYSASSFAFNLFKMMPVASWRDWDFGYKEIAKEIKAQPNDWRVVIDDPNTASYIHFLFYGVIPIEEYQKAAKTIISNQYYSSGEVLRPEKVGRFEFRSVDWPNERGDQNTLFIFPSNRLYPSEFSGDPNLSLVKTIYSPTNDPAFYIIKTSNLTKERG